MLELEPKVVAPMLKDPTALLVLESSWAFVLTPPLLPVLEEILQEQFLSVSLCNSHLDSKNSE
jgi:hypothetical protein